MQPAVLPLALHRAGLVPKAVPGLLGGRLPLIASMDGGGVTVWLARALDALDGGLREEPAELVVC